MQLEVFKKFTRAYLNQIAREIMLFLTNNAYEKSIAVSQTRRNLTARVTGNLHSCNSFALMLHKNAHVFSQSDKHNFFTYIIYQLNIVCHVMLLILLLVEKKTPMIQYDTVCRALKN